MQIPLPAREPMIGQPMIGQPMKAHDWTVGGAWLLTVLLLTAEVQLMSIGAFDMDCG